jgi:hypothetical protein
MSIASKRRDEILATLPAPVEPRVRARGDFGRDTLCIDSLQTGRYATGTALIAQRHYHRLVTPPGSLRGSKKLKDFGLGIQKWIGKLVSSPLFLASTPTQIRAELRKDDQTARVVPEIFEEDSASKDLRYRIRIQAFTDIGPFAFNVGVDEGLSFRYLGLETNG